MRTPLSRDIPHPEIDVLSGRPGKGFPLDLERTGGASLSTGQHCWDRSGGVVPSGGPNQAGPDLDEALNVTFIWVGGSLNRMPGHTCWGV